MNTYAKFKEIPLMTPKDIKETKRYGRTDGRTDRRTDNVKTVYPPTNTVCWGYKKPFEFCIYPTSMLFDIYIS